MYEQGQGVARDYAEAMRWYRLAADQGSTQPWKDVPVRPRRDARLCRSREVVPARCRRRAIQSCG
jgi:hypothetical protein